MKDLLSGFLGISTGIIGSMAFHDSFIKHEGPQTLELNPDQHMTLEEGQTATIVKINGSWHVVSSGNTDQRDDEK
jgi:hypothetical protein